MIDFPASPTIGQQFTAAGVTWTWDGAKWLPSGLSPLVVPGINDNRIINGDMRIDQRNNGASGTGTTYTVDRWSYTATQASKLTWQRAANGPVGFPYSLQFTTTTAFTPAAGDTFLLNQPIEADMVSDFAWGTANAQPVTLAFWVASSLTGTFSGAIANYGSGGTSTRAYPFSFSIPSANTWMKVSITIPGDTTGTGWLMSGNGVGAYLRFDLGSGATWRASAGAWGAGNIVGATGAVNLVATGSAVLQLTGVKLEVGSVATPFNRQSLAKSMADCCRYYQVQQQVSMIVWIGAAGGNFGQNVNHLGMRSSPTAVLSSQTYSNASGAAASPLSPTSTLLYALATAIGVAQSTVNISLAAEL